jgi:DNA-directed RNA polymerase subunit RPC12/RpoP
VSQDDNDEVVLRLKENDFKDLAYTYLAYITPHKFRRCVSCNRWIRKDSKDRRICKDCSDKGIEEKNTMKEVQCVECGKTIYVSTLNTKTCRCEECQSEALKESWKEASQRYRDTKKNKSS